MASSNLKIGWVSLPWMSMIVFNNYFTKCINVVRRKLNNLINLTCSWVGTGLYPKPPKAGQDSLKHGSQFLCEF